MEILKAVRRVMSHSTVSEIPTNTDLSKWVSKNDYPVLDAQVLLRMLDQTNRLRNIERLVGATPEVFDEFFLSSIETFALAAQLVPASMYDHHREPGGWIDHTLEVVENALQARKRSILPPGTKPEAIHEVEFIWTFAVFAAALLHDAGKLLSLTHLQPLPTGAVWTPGGLTLHEAGVTRYSVTWARYPYELQTVSSVALMGMLPKRGLSMLFRDQEVLRSIISTLTDDYQAGPLGKIINDADQESVRQYVAPGIERTSLPNVPVKPLSQRVVRALRLEIDESSMKLNTNGGAGWVKDGSIWLVCKVAIKRVRERLDGEGTTDIPDDERIYDMLLDHGQIIPNLDPVRRSIWYVSIKCDEYEHHLTMLRFERSNLIHRSKRIDDFQGAITILNRDEMLALRAAAKKTTSPTSDVTPASSAQASLSQDQIKAPSPTLGHLDQIDTVSTDKIDSVSEPMPYAVSEDAYPDLTTAEHQKEAKEPSQLKKKKTTRRKGGAKEAATIRVVAQLNERGSVDRTLIKTKPVGLDDEAVGRYFLTWVRDSIDSEKPGFVINDSDGNGLIHRIPEGMFLVHPKIIQRFVITTGIVDALPEGTQANKNPQIKTAVDTVRKRLRKEKLIAQTAKGYDVHQADVSNAKNPFVSGMLYGIVTPNWALYDKDELPPVNAAIDLWSGEYKTGTRIRPKETKTRV